MDVAHEGREGADELRGGLADKQAVAEVRADAGVVAVQCGKEASEAVGAVEIEALILVQADESEGFRVIRNGGGAADDGVEDALEDGLAGIEGEEPRDQGMMKIRRTAGGGDLRPVPELVDRLRLIGVKKVGADGKAGHAEPLVRERPGKRLGLRDRIQPLTGGRLDALKAELPRIGRHTGRAVFGKKRGKAGKQAFFHPDHPFHKALYQSPAIIAQPAVKQKYILRIFCLRGRVGDKKSLSLSADGVLQKAKGPVFFARRRCARGERRL